MAQIIRAIVRIFPFLLGWRIRLIVAYRRLTYPLRFLPFNSAVFGPPKGEYKNLRHYSRDPASKGALQLFEFTKWRRGTRKLPITNSARVTQTFAGREGFKIFGASVGVVRNGRVWGHYGGSVITPNDRLVWDLSPVNYTFHRDLHHIFAQIRLPRVTRYQKVVNLVTRGADNNYAHWLFDLLPRLELVERAGIDLRDAHYLVNHRDLPFQIESLAHLGIPRERIIKAARDVHVEAEELVLPSLINLNMNTDGLGYPPEAFQYLRTRFLGATRSPANTKRRILISRDRSNRRIRNEARLFAALQDYGFERVYLENLPMIEQARLFSEADWVLGLHGAGLANIIFCRPGTRVTEIFAPDFIVSNYWAFSDQLDLEYHCYCDDDRYQGVQGGRFQRTLDLSLSIPEFMNFFKRVQHAAPIAAEAAELEPSIAPLGSDLTQPLI